MTPDDERAALEARYRERGALRAAGAVFVGGLIATLFGALFTDTDWHVLQVMTLYCTGLAFYSRFL